MGTSFTDTKGNEWEIPPLDAPAISRIRTATDGDPDFLRTDIKSGRDETYARLKGDPILLCRVIFLLCGKQRADRGVGDEEFYMGLCGDPIDEATSALLERMKSFSPRRTRKLLDAFAEQDRLQQEMTDELAKRLNNPELAKELMAKAEAELLAKMRSSSASSLPDSSASPPTD